MKGEINMLVGTDPNGLYKLVKTNENGNLEVVVTDGSTGGETTLNASIQTVGTTATSISINKKVTTIDIANYSESGDITVGIGTSNYVIGSSIATTLVINKDVTNISLVSTEANTKVQIVVKGIEASDEGSSEQNLIPITENMTFRKLVKPSSNIVLDKPIWEYFDNVSEGEEFNETFYRDAIVPTDSLDMFSIDDLSISADFLDPETYEPTDKLYYKFNMFGYFSSPLGEYGTPMYFVNYVSEDGTTFIPNFGITTNWDQETGAPINTPVNDIESQLDINFSQISGTWNDVISEFLFTDEVINNGN